MISYLIKGIIICAGAPEPMYLESCQVHLLVSLNAGNSLPVTIQGFHPNFQKFATFLILALDSFNIKKNP